MPSRKKAKAKKRGFLRWRFLKIPIWIWLVLLIVGAVSSGKDSVPTSDTSSSPIEIVSADIVHEEPTESALLVEATNVPSIESATSVPTSEPLATQIITAAPTNTPVPTNTPAPTNDPTQYVLKKGDKNDDVRQLQKRLIALGYLSGSADGDFGSKTEKAVLTYQKAAGITATGECDYYTYKSLTSKDAPEAPKPVATEKPVTKSNDRGTPYIDNKKTKKFHYAECNSVDQMKGSSKVPLSSREEAISKNYVPCKNCTP